jgi:hypothetical protein
MRIVHDEQRRTNDVLDELAKVKGENADLRLLISLYGSQDLRRRIAAYDGETN